MTKPDPFVHILPERRLALRVPVRRPVRAAVGLRSFEALLLDLSLTGCRLRCPEPVTAHGSVWVVLPAGFGGRFPLLVRGEVARAESVRGEPTGVCDVALRFRELTPRVHERLCAALAEILQPPSPVTERRRSLRRWFGRGVVAHGVARPHVLIGRDLSSGGMRVDGARGFAPGDDLRVALYSQTSDEPLVVQARVLRCAEDGSAALEFVDPAPGQQLCLDEIIASLAAAGGEAPLVSEILEPGRSLKS